jgi:alpha/beta superfamily hydrolase
VVACPPHPQFGGNRRDARLRAVSDALGERGVDCLRIDYGDWDEGVGERTDARKSVEWAAERYDRVGLFGYSLGAVVALSVASDRTTVDDPLCAVSVLAPPARSGGGDVAGAVDGIYAPLQVLYGERDATVDWEPVVEAARERGADVQSLPGDHFFAGLGERVGGAVAAFVASASGT